MEEMEEMEELVRRSTLQRRDMKGGAIAGTVVGVIIAALVLVFCLYPVVVHQIKLRQRRRQEAILDAEAGVIGGPQRLPAASLDANGRVSSSDSLKHAELPHGGLTGTRGNDRGWLGSDKQTGPDVAQHVARSPIAHLNEDGSPRIAQFPSYDGEYMPESMVENHTGLNGTSADYYSQAIPSEAFGMVTNPEPSATQTPPMPSRAESLKHNVMHLFRRKNSRDQTMSSYSSTIVPDKDTPVQSQSAITSHPQIESPTELSPTTSALPISSLQHATASHEASQSPPSHIKTPPQSPFPERAFQHSPSPPTNPAPGTVNPMDIMQPSTQSELWYRTEHQLIASSYETSNGVTGSPEPLALTEEPLTFSASPSPATEVQPDIIGRFSPEASVPLKQESSGDDDIPMSDFQSAANLAPFVAMEQGRHPSYPSDQSTPFPGPSSTNPSSHNTPSTQLDSPSPESLGSSDFRHSASPQTGLGVPSPKHGVFRCDELDCNQVFDQPHKLKHHQRYHTKDHKCVYPGCGKGFGTKTHLQRHINDRHEKKKKFHCAIPGCDYSRTGGKAFPRKDNWKRHMTKIHNMDQRNLPEPIEVDHEMGGV